MRIIIRVLASIVVLVVVVTLAMLVAKCAVHAFGIPTP